MREVRQDGVGGLFGGFVHRQVPVVLVATIAAVADVMHLIVSIGPAAPDEITMLSFNSIRRYRET